MLSKVTDMYSSNKMSPEFQIELVCDDRLQLKTCLYNSKKISEHNES
jgi:hypothetical protein